MNLSRDASGTCCELIDVDSPWWRGYYDGWWDAADGHAATCDGGKGTAWSSGYSAGWRAGDDRHDLAHGAKPRPCVMPPVWPGTGSRGCRPARWPRRGRP